MQDQDIAGPTPTSVRARTVSGLGVCDVWRLELSAVQWPWLADELDELAARSRNHSSARLGAAGHRWHEAVADELSAQEYELRLVRTMRAQLPARDHDSAVVFVGPTQLVRELVTGALRNLVDALSEIVDAQPGDEHARSQLIETAEAARAWAQTFVDCQEVDAFGFDATADPLPLR